MSDRLATDWRNTVTRRDKHWHKARERIRANTKSLLLHSRDKTELNMRLKCVNKQKCMRKRGSGSHIPTVCFRQIIGIDAARFHGLLKKTLGTINIVPPDVIPTFMLIIEVP